MDEFDFGDGLKIVLVSIFLLGSVQLHALIDESSQHSEERDERAASRAVSAPTVDQAADVREDLDADEARLRNGPALLFKT
ncbi:hypothetical protein DFR24_4170 [Panacagrimonas perspica]|uniref:Uncharacterized protein n=1 Tax=Panacagrimonas perspica TaxID=381431 RepID=A0A4R7NWW4_9GAMM|nr:hypothetical protein [Panacagrimonas perspica]TDU25725.1 hypothetical protein DFR24_4170 [Panacagrimonas perspica]